jgi:bloom syndrome protein
MLDDLIAERRKSDEPVPDPNHENVVLISSDDDDEDADFMHPSSGSAPSPNVRSRFFGGDEPEVRHFMEQSEKSRINFSSPSYLI